MSLTAQAAKRKYLPTILSTLPMELADLPDEVTSNIVHHMDDVSSICFALTSHKNYDMVQYTKRQSLKALCPPFEGSMYVDMNEGGESEHEQLVSQLWNWLGQRCAFCGSAGRWSVPPGRERWTVVHVCWGWLSQWNEAKTWTQRQEFLAGTIEFKKNYGPMANVMLRRLVGKPKSPRPLSKIFGSEATKKLCDRNRGFE
jgi:hypothetical protein